MIILAIAICAMVILNLTSVCYRICLWGLEKRGGQRGRKVVAADPNANTIVMILVRHALKELGKDIPQEVRLQIEEELKERIALEELERLYHASSDDSEGEKP